MFVALDARMLGETVLAVARDAVDFVLRATDLTDAAELCTLFLPATGLCVFRLRTLARNDCALMLSVSSFLLGALL